MSLETTHQQRAATTANETAAPTRFYQPQVDIHEQGDELVILADIPGAVADKIDIQFEDGELTVRAPVPAEQGERRYLIREYGVGDYSRAFRIGEQIDGDRITADYTDGVLTLRLPKAETAKRRKITVG